MNISYQKTINYTWILIIFFLSEIITLHGDSLTFKKANEFFDNGKYPEAIQAYNDLSSNGVSVNLLFNLGNAHFKAGEIGKAMSSYQRALKLSPRHPDVIANLRFAHKQAQTEPIPITFRQKLIRKLSIQEWTVITSLSGSLFLILIGIFQLNPSHSKNIIWIKVFGVATCILLLFSGMSVIDYFDDKQAFATQDGAIVHTGPVEQSPELFKVTDGMELIVLGRSGEFINVQSNIGSAGWIHTNSVAFTLP
ncbi:MAG: tetratricopeptide repeat protein [Verrucomicrobiota bacterium]|nr:tetratricopeptide repeat protein [Verrucomicrobiota bacterium]